MSLWAQEHSPQHFSELAVVPEEAVQALRWARSAKDAGSRILLVSGSSGSGKSTVLNVIARALKYDLVEMDLEKLSECKTLPKKNLSGQKMLFYLDEPDYLTAKRGIKRAEELQVSLVIKSTELRISEVESIHMPKPTTGNIIEILKRILKKRATSLSSVELRRIAENAGGNLRSAINELQLLSGCGAERRAVERRMCTESFFGFCYLLFKKRLPFEELVEHSDPKITAMALASVIATCTDWRAAARAIERCSAADTLLPEYQFLGLTSFCETRSIFSFQREEALSVTDLCHSSEPHLYMKLGHARRLLVTPVCLERPAVFSYRYSPGSSKAVRRSVSLTEIMDL